MNTSLVTFPGTKDYLASHQAEMDRQMSQAIPDSRLQAETPKQYQEEEEEAAKLLKPSSSWTSESRKSGSSTDRYTAFKSQESPGSRIQAMPAVPKHRMFLATCTSRDITMVPTVEDKSTDWDSFMAEYNA